MRTVALVLIHLRTALNHPIEFIGEQTDRLVALVGSDGCIHIGAIDMDMPFGDEASRHGLFRITLELHADAKDAFLVAKQSCGFLLNKRFEGWGKFEVDSGNDYIVRVIISIHDYFRCWVD